MQFLKKLSAFILSAALAVPTFMPISSPAEVSAASVVTVSPLNTYEINDGIFEGWGTSLCWWANRLGYSDTLAKQSADLFFSEDGLHMNIVRFNIGGGDNPSHKHITRTDSNMPGYTKYNNGSVTYDWTADYNQRNVLRKAVAAYGDDLIIEMFSNSPPYYMTKSGCSSGGTDPNKNNLKDDQYEAFATYLAEVCYHYKNEWGFDIQSIDAMNEPYTNFWGANSPKQEGCHFDQGESESKIIVELQKAMSSRGMSDVIISGTDETSIDTQISSYNKLSGDAKKALGRIDTHTYGGSNRGGLKDTAISAGKNLWMSEVDGGSVAGSNAGEMGAGLWLADRIVADCNGLNCSAWILWQAIDNHISSVGYNGNKDKGMVNTSGGYWGLAVADHDNNKIILTKKYYTFGQFSRYIRPGMTMLKTSGNCMAAYDAKGGQLVIVAVNDKGSAQDFTYDLTGFSSTGSYAKCIRTSNSENWKDIGNAAVSGGRLNVSLAANSVTTFIISDVKGSASLENKIEVTSSMTSGTASWKNQGSYDYAKAFDGSTSTYFDGLENGWVQADLGKVYDISAIGFAPRAGYEYRMADGKFMFSDDGTNWTEAYTITGKPSSGMSYVTRFSGTSSARYVRYQVPSGAPANEYNKDNVYNCNIAEIELYGTPSVKGMYDKIVPVSLSGTDSWKQTASTSYEKAFDGSTSTYFDGVGNGWVQADLGGVYDIKAIGYCPRKGYEARMADGQFMISLNGTDWTELYTINGMPDFSMKYASGFTGDTKARYVRYQVPEGKPANGFNTDDVYCCNVAEIEIYGEPAEADIDLNDDGEFSSADAVLLSKFIHGSEKFTSKQLTTADINGDGFVDVFDLIMFKQKLAGIL